MGTSKKSTKRSRPQSSSPSSRGSSAPKKTKTAETTTATKSSTTKSSTAATTKAKKPNSKGTTTTTTTKSSSVVNTALPIGTTPVLPPARTLIVDNGGDTIKFGWMDNKDIAAAGAASTSSSQQPFQIPNVSARVMHQFATLVGDELTKIQNPNNLYARTRSTERGIITNLENQTRVWKRMLDLLNVTGIPLHTDTAHCLGWKAQHQQQSRRRNKNVSKSMESAATTAADAVSSENPPVKVAIPVHTIAVLLLLPPHCPRVVLEHIVEIWMADFGVAHVGFGISTVCSGYDQTQMSPYKTSCTVDLGYSSSLIVPTFHNKIINMKKKNNLATTTTPTTCIRRLPLGGRHLVNMLKYHMSYRQYNLMDQESLLCDVFERLAYVSLDFGKELQLASMKSSGRRPYDRDFVLPDYQRTFRGEIRIPPQLQKELEMEAKRRKAQEAKVGIGGEDDDEDDDEDEEEDEDFEVGDDDDDEDVELEDFVETDEVRAPKAKQKKKSKKISESAEENDNDDDDDIDEEEEESMEAKRKRLLQQRAEEERRRRLQEEEEQVLRVSVERFAIPEVLFRPLDVGLPPDMVGLCQSIVQSVQACPKAYRPALYRSIYVVGGVAQLPNLKERLEQELRPLIPAEYEMVVTVATSPVDRAWHGAKSIFQNIPYNKWSISRQEWEAAATNTSPNNKSYKRLLNETDGYYF